MPCETARAADAPTALTAADLAAKLNTALEDGSSLVRARMEIKGDATTTLQLQIKQRRSKGSTEVVYRVLWPKERKGEAVLLRKTGDKAASGALFVPPATVRNLDASNMKDALFGSDLTYADIVENFYAWDQQSIAGTEVVDGVTCQILLSKPGKSDRSLYGSVRSWIDTRRMVPLRVEKYSAGGDLLRRIDTTRVVAVDGRQTPANLLVRRPGQSSSTAIDGSQIKRDTTFSDRDFSAEGLKETSSPGAASD
jgi:hypothetical protein